RRTDTLPGAFSRKAVEAVIAAGDARLREQAAHFEQRLNTELAAIRREVAGHRAAGPHETVQQGQLPREPVNSQHSESTQSITKLVAEKIGEGIEQSARMRALQHGALATAREEALNQRLEPIKGDITSLQQRAGQADRELLDMVLALGRLCLHTAE